jgi:hypothetical protein
MQKTQAEETGNLLLEKVYFCFPKEYSASYTTTNLTVSEEILFEKALKERLSDSIFRTFFSNQNETLLFTHRQSKEISIFYPNIAS